MANLEVDVRGGELRSWVGFAMISLDELVVVPWVFVVDKGGVLSLGKDGMDSDFFGILAT